MLDHSKITVNQKTPLKEVMTILDREVDMKIVMVVNHDKELVGTITDGDIRRALLNGHNLSSTANDVMFEDFKHVTATTAMDVVQSTMVQHDITQLPVLDNKKLIGIHLFNELKSPTHYDNPVVIMAGGLGTRLSPLTDNCPKPMLTVAGKPILEHIINNLVANGFSNIYLSVNYLSEQIEQYFKNGADFNCKIQYLHEKEKLGTAGALSLLPQDINKTIVVMNADVLTRVDFNHLMRFHNTHSSNLTVCIREFQSKVPFGVVKLNNERITKIIEKPIQKHFISAGIYAIEPTSLDTLIPGKPLDMPIFIENLIEKEQKICGFPIHEYWMDVGQHAEFQQAHVDYSTDH